MDTQEMIDLCKQHSLFTWTASGTVDPMPIASAKGVYLYKPDGTKVLDFNSQLMSVNVGHSHPKVIARIKQQLDKVCYTFPHSATEPRAELSKLLADNAPGDINTFFYTLSGAESNENAIKAARLFTGRQKILARYRSYHGATNACMQLTGDPRRWHNEPGMPGVVHVMDPRPYDYSFGETEEEMTKNNLIYLREVIEYEGPDTIAAMFVETITGTNGVMPPTKGYLQGLRKLLDEYGILLVCDEVMAGFGRTGKLFAFEHYDIIPDMVCMAKGLTSSYIPLGAVGMRDKIADHFRENVFWGGLTYSAHALACSAALGSIETMLEENMLENAQKMGKVMRSEMDRLTEKHPSVRGGRCIGLFGMMDLQKNSKGDYIAGYNDSSNPYVKRFAKFLRDNDLFTFVRWRHFMCNPPLCITEEQLLEGFEIIDRGLSITDEAFEG